MKKQLSKEQAVMLMNVLEKRFNDNMHRHKGASWQTIHNKLVSQPEKLWSLWCMEESGGEPDVVNHDTATNEYVFFDCAVESPKGRRSLCYDQAAHESRKEYKPKNSATAVAEDMGVTLLNEEQYRYLQTLGAFDLKTSSWIITPESIRKRGGALFCDRRYETVFTYHNSAESYYASRGFRARIVL